MFCHIIRIEEDDFSGDLTLTGSFWPACFFSWSPHFWCSAACEQSILAMALAAGRPTLPGANRNLGSIQVSKTMFLANCCAPSDLETAPMFHTDMDTYRHPPHTYLIQATATVLLRFSTSSLWLGHHLWGVSPGYFRSCSTVRGEKMLRFDLVDGNGWSTTGVQLVLLPGPSRPALAPGPVVLVPGRACSSSRFQFLGSVWRFDCYLWWPSVI